MKYHKRGILEYQKCVTLQFWRLKVWKKMWPRDTILFLSQGCEGGSVVCLSPSILVIAGSSFLTGFNQSLYPWSLGVSQCLFMCLSLCAWLSSLHTRTAVVLDLESQPNQMWPHLHLVTSAKILFFNKQTFMETTGQDTSTSFGGQKFNPLYTMISFCLLTLEDNRM